MSVTDEQMGLEFKAGQQGQDAAADHIGSESFAVLRSWTLTMAEDRGDAGFIADEVRASLPIWVRLKLEDAPNAMGALFRRLAKDRLIERAPDKAPRPATHEGSRGRMQPVWRRVRAGA